MIPQYPVNQTMDFIEQFIRTLANYLNPTEETFPATQIIEGISGAVLKPVMPGMDNGILGISVIDWEAGEAEMGGRSFASAMSTYHLALGHMVVDMNEESMLTVHRQTAKRLQVALETPSELRVALQSITSVQESGQEGFLKLKVPAIRFASDEIETGTFVALSVTELHVTTQFR